MFNNDSIMINMSRPRLTEETIMKVFEKYTLT